MNPDWVDWASAQQSANAQDYAKRSAWQNNYIAGYYPCCEYPVEPDGSCGLCGTRLSDAPYSFWLGAEAA